MKNNITRFDVIIKVNIFSLELDINNFLKKFYVWATKNLMRLLKYAKHLLLIDGASSLQNGECGK